MRHSSCLSKTSSHMIDVNWRGMTVVWHLLQQYCSDAFKGQNPTKETEKLHFSWEVTCISHQAWLLSLMFLCMSQLTHLWTWLNIQSIHLIPVLCNWTLLGIYFATRIPNTPFLWILCNIFLKCHRVFLSVKEKKKSVQLSCFPRFCFLTSLFKRQMESLSVEVSSINEQESHGIFFGQLLPAEKIPEKSHHNHC